MMRTVQKVEEKPWIDFKIRSQYIEDGKITEHQYI